MPRLNALRPHRWLISFVKSRKWGILTFVNILAKAEGFTDVVVKSIEVKPEGFPVENMQSVFQCLGEEGYDDIEDVDQVANVEISDLELPEALVNGSERAWVQVSGLHQQYLVMPIKTDLLIQGLRRRPRP